MSVYFVCPKDTFDNKKLKLKLGNVKMKFLSSNNEDNFKILCKDDNEKVIVYDADFAGWNFPNKILEEVKNIKAICLGTTTKSYINENLCESKNIKIVNIPKYSTDSVAEYMIMLMFALAKKIPLQLKNNNNQDFDNKFTQMQLRGKTIGIIGLGNIGNRIAEICSGIGMNVVYWNRTAKNTQYKLETLENIFSKANVVIVTLATTDETKKIITDKLLKLMTPTTIFISVAGKNIFNHELVVKMAEQNKIYGYGLEQPDTPLENYKGNIMVTSEYAWFTEESQNARLDLWLDNISNEIKELL